MDGYDRVSAIVFAAQQHLELDGFQKRGEFPDQIGELRVDRFTFAPQLEKGLPVLDVPLDLGVEFDAFRESCLAAQGLARLLRRGPEVRRRDHFVQFVDLPQLARAVKDTSGTRRYGLSTLRIAPAVHRSWSSSFIQADTEPG